MSTKPGDVVYLCGPSGPIEAVFISSAGPDCVIEVDGIRMVVLCSMLNGRADQCSIDRAQLASGERVALRLENGALGNRSWPATVQRTHRNGRVSILMDGLTSVQTVDRDLLFKL